MNTRIRQFQLKFKYILIVSIKRNINMTYVCNKYFLNLFAEVHTHFLREETHKTLNYFKNI